MHAYMHACRLRVYERPPDHHCRAANLVAQSMWAVTVSIFDRNYRISGARGALAGTEAVLKTKSSAQPMRVVLLPVCRTP